MNPAKTPHAQRKSIFQPGCVRLAIITIIALVVWMAALPGGCFQRRRFELARAANDAAHIRMAIESFRSEYAAIPTGDAARIIAVLRGDNPKKIFFIVLPSKPFNAAGEYLDPWGTPYRIDLTDPAHPKIHSFGPDKKDAAGAFGSDDIASWRH